MLLAVSGSKVGLSWLVCRGAGGEAMSLTPSCEITRPLSSVSSRKRITSSDYMLQGFVTKSLFSVRLDPFHWR